MDNSNVITKKRKEPEENAKSNEDDFSSILTTAQASRKVWLVKIPSFLAEAWSKQSDKTDALGTINIKEDVATKVYDMSIKLKESPTIQDLPKEYSLNCKPPPNLMNIFSENQEDGRMAIEGTVEFSCDVKPQYSEEYKRLCRGRLDKSMTKTRVLKTIDQEKDKELMKPIRENLTKKKVEDKRERIDKDVLIDKIFTLFEKQAFYDLKTLASETKQPTQYLKEVLTDLCVFNKRGPRKGMFELQPQLKNRADKEPGTH